MNLVMLHLVFFLHSTLITFFVTFIFKKIVFDFHLKIRKKCVVFL